MSKRELTPQQKLFCLKYVSKGDTFSNATLSYAEAYEYDLPRDENEKIIVGSKEYNICKANGSRTLSNDSIREGIRNMWLERFNDAEIDARVSEIALTGQESNAIQAVKVYNDLKNRITKRVDVTTNGRPLASLSDDDLRKLSE